MPKTVSIDSVLQGRLYINPPVSGQLLVERDYRFVGTSPVDQQLLDRTGTQVFSAMVSFSAIPVNIQQALIAIDNWTGSQINTLEGL